MASPRSPAVERNLTERDVQVGNEGKAFSAACVGTRVSAAAGEPQGVPEVHAREGIDGAAGRLFDDSPEAGRGFLRVSPPSKPTIASPVSAGSERASSRSADWNSRVAAGRWFSRSSRIP